MKKVFLSILPLMVIFLISVAARGPVAPASLSGKKDPRIVIPEKINTLFTNSCMPCHSDEGNKLAKIGLNFSKWDRYGRATQLRKGGAISRKIAKGKMPPAQFNESNPDLVLTQEQRKDIVQWGQSLKKK